MLDGARMSDRDGWNDLVVSKYEATPAKDTGQQRRMLEPDTASNNELAGNAASQVPWARSPMLCIYDERTMPSFVAAHGPHLPQPAVFQPPQNAE
jgi:hypothetical protein